MKLKMSKEVDLGKEPIGHLLFVLAVPSIISQVVNALYNMVDRMYIGHIPGEGAAALTGLGVCFPIIMIVSAFAALMGMGGAPRASILMGKKDNEGAEKILGNCFSALVITAVVLTALVLVFKRPLLMMFGASENTLGYAESYLNIYAVGTIFVQLTLGLNAFIAAQGFSKISMMTVVIGAVTNIVLDPIFIFGFHMGVRGAAQAISAVWAIRFLSGKDTVLRLKKENFRIRKDVMVPCIGLGFAPFIMQSTESILVLCFNSSLLKYGGDLAVGAMTILSSVMQFAMLPLQGLTQGGQPIISYNFGANNPERVRKGFRLLLLSSVIYAACIWAVAELLPGVFVTIFTNDLQLAEFARWAMRIYMAAVVLMGAQIACQQTFIAFGNSKISAFLAMFRKIIVLIPLIYILPVFLEDNVQAVFLAEPIADVIAVATTLILFRKNFKKVLAEMKQKSETQDI